MTEQRRFRAHGKEYDLSAGIGGWERVVSERVAGTGASEILLSASQALSSA